MHSSARLADENVPAWHAEHVEAPLLLAFPAKQSLQRLLSLDAFPAAHGSHVPLSVSFSFVLPHATQLTSFWHAHFLMASKLLHWVLNQCGVGSYQKKMQLINQLITQMLFGGLIDKKMEINQSKINRSII